MKQDMKWMLVYTWILSIAAAVFLGHEINQSMHDREITLARQKINNCHKIIVGEMYGN